MRTRVHQLNHSERAHYQSLIFLKSSTVTVSKYRHRRELLGYLGYSESEQRNRKYYVELEFEPGDRDEPEEEGGERPHTFF